jgi:hypothetical protein
MSRILTLLPSYTRPTLTPPTLKAILNGPTPVLLSKCFDDMPAVTKWPQKLYLVQFAQQPIQMELSRLDAPGYGERHEISLGEYLDMLDHPLPYRIYMAQFPLFERIPQLQDDVTTDLVNDILRLGEKYSTSTWIGKQSLTPLHHDPKALTNLFVQVCGRKRVRLFSPEMDKGKLSVGQGTLRNTAGVDVWGEMDLGEGFEGIVGQGDGLIIPKGWWHSLRSDDDVFNISVNWWLKVWD